MTGAPTNYLQALVRDGGVTEWERKFCASIIAQMRKGRAISDKQSGILSRIVDDFKARTMGGEVIE